MTDFAQKLLSWYADNKRLLPWRDSNDPYKIWISEVILQQTRVDQGIDYYLRFVSRFPDVESLAVATEDDVLKMWQGLGYYSRARNLHFTAKTIVNHFKGKFPETFPELIPLKGIGPYTAAAIASIAFGRATPVMDGNVMRVVTRWFAIDDPIDTANGKKMITAALNEIFDTDAPGTFNQAIMDFGAMVCKPVNPNCQDCIFNSTCAALANNHVNYIPRKSKTIKQRKRFFNYLVIVFPNEGEVFTIMNKRNESDIWSGLYEFPLIESDAELSPEEMMRSKLWQEFFIESTPEIFNRTGTIRHQLTHQQLFAVFYQIHLRQNIPDKFKNNMVNLKDLHSFPIPRLIERYLAKDKSIRLIFKDFLSDSTYKR